MTLKIVALFLLVLQAVGTTPVQTMSANKSTADSAKCRAGEFWSRETASCQQCPNGTYMTKEKAATGVKYACYPCSQHDSATHEVLAEPCSKTKDATILCKKSYYRKIGSSPRDSHCTTCGICGVGANIGLPHTKAACINYTDTVCSLPPNITTERNNGVTLVSYSLFVMGNCILYMLVSSFARGFYLFS